MRIESYAGGYKVTVPCKINLFLEVLGKRSDGYHDLDTVMLAVSLCDELTFLPDRSGEFRLQVTLEDGQPLTDTDPAWNIPGDDRNLVIRAMRLLVDRLSVESFASDHGDPKSLGGTIHLHKRIPSMAGLGGGSADAAAALWLAFLALSPSAEAMFRGWDQLLQWARELGSDN